MAMTKKQDDDGSVFGVKPDMTLGTVFRHVMQRDKIGSFKKLGETIDVADVTVGRICNDQQPTINTESLALFSRHYNIPLAPLLLLNSIRSLPQQMQARVGVLPTFFDILINADTADSRLLPVFSDIQLPYSIWLKGKKRGKSAAEILAGSVTDESGARDLGDKFLNGETFIFRFSGTHMLSTNPGAKIIPPGAHLLIRECAEHDLGNGDLVLVQLLPSGKQKKVEPAQVYVYSRRTSDGYVYETYRPSSPDPIHATRVRHSGKFGEKDLRESRIIYGKVVRIVDHRF